MCVLCVGVKVCKVGSSKNTRGSKGVKEDKAGW